MEDKLTNTILMIKPVHFRHNEQTAVNNHYQEKGIEPSIAQQMAEQEFDGFVSTLRSNGVEVIVLLDNEDHDTPDSLFPNNWVSFHTEGTVGLYPMFAENRRLERRDDVFDYLELQGFPVKKKIDFTHWEKDSQFLEGTGSLVLDRENKIAYAAMSERTHAKVLDDFEEKMGYTSVRFSAYQDADTGRELIYHTNVLMSMGDHYAMICLDAIENDAEKNEVILSLTSTGKEIIELTEEQVFNFAGNALQLINQDGEKLLVLSERAETILTESQMAELLKCNDRIVSSSLETIEKLGGGSARCMMAEVFLKNS